MPSLFILKRILIILLFVQVGGGAGRTPPPKMVSPKEAGRIMMDRIKSATPEQLNKGQLQAGKKLQSNFARAMATMANKKSAKEVPLEVRESAKEILSAVKNGQLTDAMVQSLPSILVNLPTRATPAQQLQTIIGDVMPRAGFELKAPLQGVMDFVKSNVAGVNGLLGRVMNGAPNLLNGVVSSLANTLGGVNSAVNGSLDSLNNMVGGLLGGLPIGGLLPGGGGGGGLLGGVTGSLGGGGGGLLGGVTGSLGGGGQGSGQGGGIGGIGGVGGLLG